VTGSGKWYYYSNGQVQTGWASLGRQWYYFDSAGVMQTGWASYGSQWYFLDPTSGAMKTDWVKYNGEWYYLDSNGAMKTGWLKYNGAWYYLDAFGVMKTGWVRSFGEWYYLDASGAMKTDWVNSNGEWYYLDSNGAMKTGWLKYNDVWYYLDVFGVMKTGWVKSFGEWYYLDASGAMKTDWVNSNGEWYYLDSSGAMKTGWLLNNGNRYYLDKDSGAMKTGWVEIDSKWYYFYQNGQMASDTVIEGYNLGKDGAWIQVDYVALGDSLAAGMTPQGQDRPPVNGVDPDFGYPNYIAEDFAKSYQLLKFVNFGVSGYKADNVIADLDKETVQQEVKNATHLTIDIGANDLLPVVQTNPSQAQAEIANISGKINTILNRIDVLNPNVKVYVMGYYNPFPYVTDVAQKAQLDLLLNAFNGQIQAQAIQHGDTFVPTSQVINVSNFADYIPNPQNIHLSLPGYQLVAGEFWKAMQN
jgi:glucan-binding YG repeat protein